VTTFLRSSVGIQVTMILLAVLLIAVSCSGGGRGF
jgi:hypothetical protein